jgi:hypothetical protein
VLQAGRTPSDAVIVTLPRCTRERALTGGEAAPLDQPWRASHRSGHDDAKAVAIPRFVPLLFINSVAGALIAAAPIGLMGGVATAAYLDLTIRSCPRGLRGTLLMMSGALISIVSSLGNVLGTNLYDDFGGFTVCLMAITLVYALILPVLLLVPKRLVDTADGQKPEVAFSTD